MESYDTAAVAAVSTEVHRTVNTRAGGMTFVKQPSALYAGTLAGELVVPRLDPVEASPVMKQLTRALKLSFKLDDIEGVNALEGYFNGVYPALLLSTGKATAEAKKAAPRMAAVFAAPVTKAGTKAASQTGPNADTKAEPQAEPTAQTTVEVSLLGLLDPEGGKVYRSTLHLTLKGADGWTRQVEADLTRVLTDIFKAGGEGPVMEPPAIGIKVEATPVSLTAAVESWSLGAGSGTIYCSITGGLQN